MKKNILKLLLLLLLFFLGTINAANADYKCCSPTNSSSCGDVSSGSCNPNPCPQNLSCFPVTSSGDPPPVSLNNPLTGNTENINVNQLVGRIINSVLGIVGSLALLMFVYGGLTWMTAAGASDKVQKGRDIIIWAIIGLIVVFMAYALVNFVLKTVIGGAA